MPYTKDQKTAARIALSAKRGKTSKSSLRGASKSMYDSMSEKELERFISKPTKDESINHIALQITEDPDIFMEKELTYKARKKLPDSAFVFPDERKYPIHDKSHARNALSRVSQHGTPEEKKKVRAAVKRKYPSIEQDSE